jgi:hypothetical protein
MAKHPASSVKIKQVNVVLVLKNKDLRRLDILDCLRPSVVIEGADGKCRTIVMTDWRQSPVNWFEEIKKAVKYFSGDARHAVHDAASQLWRKIKAAVYAESRRKSTHERFETARRRAMRSSLLAEIKSSLTALSKKEIAKHIRPKDLAEVWKRLQQEKMVEEVMID